MEILIVFIIMLVVLIGFAFGLYKYKNLSPKPDYLEYYKTQDKVPEGKVGVFATSLIMTEEHDHPFWYNIAYKVFTQVIPWPFRMFAFQDNGVALMDPAHTHAKKEFTPTRLVDPFGRERDSDGFPWMDKYKKGELTWVPPSRMIYLDHGYFLYKGHKSGEPTIVGKMANYSRLYYYGKGIVQKKCPHWEGSFKIIDGTFGRLNEKYPDVEFRAETSLFHYESRETLRELMDAGCDTIVIAAPMSIFSHFE